jgi:hypothetical protein
LLDVVSHLATEPKNASLNFQLILLWMGDIGLESFSEPLQCRVMFSPRPRDPDVPERDGAIAVFV